MVPQPMPCQMPDTTKMVVNHSGSAMKGMVSLPMLANQLLMGPLVERISRTMPATITMEMK